MGIEFISRIRKTIRRSWSRAVVTFATPNILSPSTQNQPRRLLFDVAPTEVLQPGELLLIRVSGASLVALRSVEILATATDPPEEAKATIVGVGGFASGLVTKINPLSGTAEISLDTARFQ